MKQKYLIGTGIVAIMLSAPSAAFAQDETDLSDNEVFCTIVESLGNGDMNARILGDIDRRYAGASYRINRRKTFVIHNVENIRFSGCEMTLRMRVTLRRKIRRNANGTATVRATMQNFRYDARTRSGRGCVKNARISDVDVSRTLRVGEAIYRRVANKFIEQDVCFDFSA